MQELSGDMPPVIEELCILKEPRALGVSITESRHSADDSGGSGSMRNSVIGEDQTPDTRDSSVFVSFETLKRRVSKQQSECTIMDSLGEMDEEKESSEPSIGGGVAPNTGYLDHTNLKEPSGISTMVGSQSDTDWAEEVDSSTSHADTFKSDGKRRSSEIFPIPQLVRRMPQCIAKSAVGSQSDTDSVEKVDSSAPSANASKSVEKSRSSGFFPMPQLVRRVPQSIALGYSSGAGTLKNPQHESDMERRRRQSMEYPMHLLQGSTKNDGVPVIPEAPGKIRIHIPDPPESKKNKMRKKVKRKRSINRDKKDFPMREKLKAYREAKNKPTIDQKKQRRSVHKAGPQEIGVSHGFHGLEADTDGKFYGPLDYRPTYRIGPLRKKSANDGPISVGRNDDYDAANYRKISSYGVDGYRPLYTKPPPPRKKSRALGPTDIGRSSYSPEDSYDVDISSEDFLKEKTLYPPLSKNNPNKGKTAEHKEGPREIGRVHKSEWTPYKAAYE